MDDIIAPVQSAFVPGRLITDNILLACECMHKIKNCKKAKTGYCAVKLEEDRVEWIFLERMMKRLGFHDNFVSLIMACVRSIKYRVRYNDQETEGFV